MRYGKETSLDGIASAVGALQIAVHAARLMYKLGIS